MKSAVLTLVCSIGLITIPAVRAAAQQSVNPVPLINEPLLPDARRLGGEAFTLTVNGTGFAPGAKVLSNGKAAPTTFVSQSRLTATVKTYQLGTAAVTVVNPAPGGGTSNVAYFEVTDPSTSVAFSAITEFGAGDNPSSLAVGDLNGDGKQDLAVTNSLSNNVSILLGNGDGTFQPAVNYALGAGTFHGTPSAAVGDFNGDGKPDLAVATADYVAVLLGNGDGTFQAAVSYAAGPSFSAVVVGDFNGDGKLDLAVTANANDEVNILLGNGDGTFQPPVSYSVGQAPLSLQAGDFNGDGRLDLAVANYYSENVSILLGNGDGSFKTAVNYPVGAYPLFGPVGDFNGDGSLDLAVGNAGNNNVSVLLGNGDGTFQPALNFPVGRSPGAPAVGDFNGDGKLDLAVSNDYSDSIGNISLLLGNGDGTFQPAVTLNTQTFPASAVIGDFNGDGRLDLHRR